jgi:hypothetical protein
MEIFMKSHTKTSKLNIDLAQETSSFGCCLTAYFCMPSELIKKSMQSIA